MALIEGFLGSAERKAERENERAKAEVDEEEEEGSAQVLALAARRMPRRTVEELDIILAWSMVERGGDKEVKMDNALAVIEVF